MRKIINSETRKYEENVTDTLILDATPTVNSFNSVTSDGVARAIAGASGEVPQVTESDNGKVLMAVYDAGGPAVEWGTGPTVDQTYDAESTNAQSGVAVASAIGSVNAVPSSDVEDAGKVLTVDASGDAGWETLSIPTVDQTYDGTSANAQSGTAVAEAIGTVNAVPASTSVDEGKVLTVDNAGSAAWATPAVPTVDQTYDATSANAQSGVAVAEAVGGVLPSLTGNAGKVLAVNSGATGTEWVAQQGGADQPLPAVGTNVLRFEFEDMSFDPTNDTGCNFTGTSWAKVTEATTRNIWDCTLAVAASEGAHFAITEPCKVIDGNLTYALAYTFGGSTGSTGLTSVVVTIGAANCLVAFSNCTGLVYAEIHAGATYAFGSNAASSMFSGCTALRRVKFVKQPNNYRLFMLNNAYGCFNNCYSLEAIEGDVAFGQSVLEGGTINGGSMFSNCHSLKSIDNLYSMEYPGIRLSNAQYMFSYCYSLKSIGFPISLSGGSCEMMFCECINLEHVALIDFIGGNHSMKSMFEDCYSLQSVNLIHTEAVADMSRAFKMNDRAGNYSIANSLLKLPVFPTDGATNVRNMFAYNIYADGALAMYQQLSQQANPPTTTTGCFTRCGSVTHASDLAQIPTSWGGSGT